MKNTGLKINGGKGMKSFLSGLKRKLLRQKVLNVGFLEGSTEGKDNIPTPLVAFWNEFGGKFTIPAHEQTIYRSVKESGEFNQKGRFVKKSKSNYATTHHVEAVEVTRPPRPFFRRMIWLGQEHWGSDLSLLLQSSDYNSDAALTLLGESMKGELQESIKANVYTPLAKSTIKKKGNDQQLIESGDMWNAVEYEVKS